MLDEFILLCSVKGAELCVYVIQQVKLALGAGKVAVYLAHPGKTQSLLAGKLYVARLGEYKAIPCVRNAPLLVETGNAVVGGAYLLRGHPYGNAAHLIHNPFKHGEINQHIFGEVQTEVAVYGFKQQLCASLHCGGIHFAIALARDVYQHIPHEGGELKAVVHRVYGGNHHGIRV